MLSPIVGVPTVPSCLPPPAPTKRPSFVRSDPKGPAGRLRVRVPAPGRVSVRRVEDRLPGEVGGAGERGPGGGDRRPLGVPASRSGEGQGGAGAVLRGQGSAGRRHGGRARGVQGRSDGASTSLVLLCSCCFPLRWAGVCWGLAMKEAALYFLFGGRWFAAVPRRENI